MGTRVYIHGVAGLCGRVGTREGSAGSERFLASPRRQGRGRGGPGHLLRWRRWPVATLDAALLAAHPPAAHAPVTLRSYSRVHPWRHLRRIVRRRGRQAQDGHGDGVHLRRHPLAVPYRPGSPQGLPHQPLLTASRAVAGRLEQSTRLGRRRRGRRRLRLAPWPAVCPGGTVAARPMSS